MFERRIFSISRGWSWLVFAWFVAGNWPDSQGHAEAAKRPNIVLILADDLGYGDLACQGATDVATPHLDRLAATGVRLTDCYSNGCVCTPTRAALLTGRYQQRLGMEWVLVHEDKAPGLPTDEVTVARLLKDVGYATGIFGKWHLGFQPEFGPNAHGFDEFFGILGGNVDMYSHREIRGEDDLFENGRPIRTEGYLTDLITDRAVRFVERHRDEPFFLYVPFNAVHWPFQKPNDPGDVRDRETWFQGTRKDFCSMVESLDGSVGKILAALDQADLTDDTLVIFTSDNGGERLSNMGPLFHRKATLWEGGLRVPGIVRWPRRLPAAKVSRQPAISMDFAATILGAAGVSPASDKPLDGVDLLPLLAEDSPPLERALFWRVRHADRRQSAIRLGRWKFVHDAGIDMLFDLEADIGERRDVGFEHPERLADLARRLEEWELEMNKERPRFTVR